MKKIKYFLGTVALAAAVTSCIGDLNVTPIDPNTDTANNVLTDASALDAYISGIYLGFATSGYYGANGGASISGLDDGASQYLRGLYHLNELATDESVCGWNDQTIKDFHYMTWTPEDVFIYAFYSRVMLQVSVANEFIRELSIISADEAVKNRYRDEARVLRALAYYHAIDNFGNVPFSDESANVGDVPSQISRLELFNWLESELKDVIESGNLPDKASTVYGHAGMGAAKFLLAKLYLNAEVYTGTPAYDKCATILSDLMDDGYSLHKTSAGKYSPYQELFIADNDRCTDEIIFAIEQDGQYITSYGATNYLIFASTGGMMNVNEIGISSGWGGLRTTPEFFNKFEAGDARRLFYTKEDSEADIDAMPETPEERGDKPEDIQKLKDDDKYDKECENLLKAKNKAREESVQQLDIDEIGTFTHGYGFRKFLNITSAGIIPNQVLDEKTGKMNNPGFVNTDFPVMRYADVLLMAAECEARNASINGKDGFDEVRARAGLAPIAMTLDNILDERGRELYQECWRRNDLIRFGKFTSGYNWQWKGNVKEGEDVDAYRTLYPIPSADRQANTSLVQNEGY